MYVKGDKYMSEATFYIILLICLPIFFLFGFLVRFLYAKSRLTSIEQEGERKKEEYRLEAESTKAEILLEGTNQLLEERRAQEKENKEYRLELQKSEKRLAERQESLDRYENELKAAEKRISEKENEVIQLGEKVNQELERIAMMSQAEAKQELVSAIAEEAKRDATVLVNKIEQDAKNEGEKLAQKIIVTTMQRLAPGVVADNCVTSVSLQTDEMKGRIIGREGRNIRALENITGVDIIIDDTPEAVVVSCFNPVRREIARQALEVLIQDGRIHPARIEEVVAKIEKEINKKIFEEGENVIMDLGLTSMSQEMTRTIGRLYYRKSYGQSVLVHSKETAIIAAMIASELGLNVALAKRGALLHDIGKGIDTESEAGHAERGAEIASRLGESKAVVNIIMSHHNDVEPESLEAVVVQIADAISASRPGARKGSAENYIKRLESLEKIATSFEGVGKAFAIQAGRDLRIVVDESRVSDQRAKEIAKEIAKRVSAELQFPGKIRITIVRESRFVEYAS